MYIEINEGEFVREFQSVRPEQFSVSALRALFEFLEEMEQDTGEPTELDVIAICCDWAEYTPQELLTEYSHIFNADWIEYHTGKDAGDMGGMERLIEYAAADIEIDVFAEELNEHTMVIRTDDSLVVLAF